MRTRRGGRRSADLLRRFLTAAAAAILASTLCAQAPSNQPRLSRLDRLEHWAAAVEGHRVNTLDAALGEVSRWSVTDLRELTINVRSLLSLIRDARTRTFLRPSENARSPLPIQVLYGAGELQRLLVLANRLRPSNETVLLRRAALLHTDVVVLGNGSDSAARRSETSGVVVRFADGQQSALEDSGGQWEMARFLLNQIWLDKNKDIRPNPRRDDWVRRWYRTVVLFTLSRMQLHERLVLQGTELFPEDPELLYLGAALHETFASPAIQEMVRRVELPRGVTLGVGSSRAELHEAEDLFRRSLKGDPGFVEGHLRLGHVLAQLDRHREAMAELDTVPSRTEVALLQYYAQLFRGRSLAALGNGAEARAANEAAARLFPSAQSPLIALSQLANAGGDGRGTVEALERLFLLPESDDGSDDPWWVYATSSGRFFDGSMADLVATLQAGAGS